MSERLMIMGAGGYLGRALVSECLTRDLEFYGAHYKEDWNDEPASLSKLFDCIQPVLVINAAAFIPTPSVDLCSRFPLQTIGGNIVLPALLTAECRQRNLPLMHLSTGCLFDEQREYLETDVPTRGWGGHCGFYVGSKLVAESIVREWPKHYLLRLRLPFDEFDDPRNYLSKLLGFKTVFDHVNSLTHRGDFAKAALDLWQLKAEFGTYHMVNPGHISAKETLSMMLYSRLDDKHWEPCPRPVQFVTNETTGCKLSTRKLLHAGVKIRDVHDALFESIANWKKAYV